MDIKEVIYDVIVIGGGPAGMMAAGRAAECGARVLVLEKNDDLGKKLLITGGGRCNLTNAGPDFLEKFKRDKKFLFSPFSRFGVDDTLRFFHGRGIETKIEEGGRVFPVSEQARSVWDALARYMEEGKVEVRSSVFVKGFEWEDGKITALRISSTLRGTEQLSASAYILATGGLSHPETGSTGDGFRFLEALGHTVRQPEPSLVPIKTREGWAHALSGLALEAATLRVFQGGKKRFERQGKMLFTYFGLSGPVVLNMSRDVKELAKQGTVEIALDLLPKRDQGEIDQLLQEALSEHHKRHAGNSLGGIVLPALVPAILSAAGVDPDKPSHAVTREERLAIGRTLRHLPMTVTGFLGAEKAIVTSGGVSLREVDLGSMRSRKYPELYLVGDILDIDRPSGGYSLQLCWTTGYVAGEAAAGMATKKSA